MSAKKYVACVAGFMFVFMAGNLALWHCAVKYSFIQEDLNRMGSFATTDSLTRNVKYSKRHVELKDYLASVKKESFDILTIGDSFSNGGGRVFYQDYLTEKYGLNIVNVMFRMHCLEELYILMQSGMLDEIQPSVVILESVGRKVQSRLGTSEISLSAFSMTREGIERFLRNRVKKTSGQLASGFFAPVMGEAIRNYMSNVVYHARNPERLGLEVHIAGLDSEIFTNPGYENTLLYLRDSLQYLNNSPNAEMINKNLNNVAKNSRRQKHKANLHAVRR